MMLRFLLIRSFAPGKTWLKIFFLANVCVLAIVSLVLSWLWSALYAQSPIVGTVVILCLTTAYTVVQILALNTPLALDRGLAMEFCAYMKARSRSPSP